MVTVLIYLTNGFVVRGETEETRVEVLRGPRTAGLWLPLQDAAVQRPGEVTYMSVGTLNVCTDSMSAWTAW